MPVELCCDGTMTTAFLSGEIDHHTAAPTRCEIDAHICCARPRVLRLDFGAVSFMDSSGVGLVMGRYRCVSAYGGKIELSSLSPVIKKVMQLSGIEKIAKIV